MLPCREGTPLKAFLVQVAVLLNHQNGRDTHLRQIRIFGPRESSNLCTDTLEHLSPEFAMYSCVRLGLNESGFFLTQPVSQAPTATCLSFTTS